MIERADLGCDESCERQGAAWTLCSNYLAMLPRVLCHAFLAEQQSSSFLTVASLPLPALLSPF